MYLIVSINSVCRMYH